MKKIIKCFGLIIAVFCLFKTTVSAGSLSISASTSSVTVGGKVIITVKANNVAGTISLSSSNGSVLSGGATGVWVDNEIKTFSFQANSAGNATITLTPTNLADYDTNDVYTASKSVTVTVKEKQIVVLSSDSSLSGLSVENATLSPDFSSSTKEYSVSLEPETTSININATANHSGASISGAGAREVTDGDNRLEVVVTAENGTTSTYVINANVKEYDPIKVNIDNKEYTVVRKKSQLTAPNNYTETTVKLGEEEVPAFTSEITKFVLIGLKDSEGNINLYIYDEKDKTYTLYKEYGFSKVVLFPMELKEIPKNYHKTKITYNDQEITAYKANDKSGYALIYGMNVETGKINTYMYDSVEDTLQIYNTEEVDLLNEQIEQMGKLILAIGMAVIILVIVIFICIIIIKKGKNKPYDSKHGKSKKELKKEKKEQKKMAKLEDDEISVTAIKKTF